MFKERCAVVSQEKVAPGHFVLTLRSPKIASAAKPGQFVQVLCRDSYDPLLPRPFSFLDTTKSQFSILYHVVGKGTEILSQVKKGETLSVLGPSGNGFCAEGAPKGTRFLMAGGGVGIPPLYHFAKSLAVRKVPRADIHVFLGARDKSLLLCQAEFKKLGVALHLATNDGSKGKKGFVTHILDDYLKKEGKDGARVFTCGPNAMMKAVSALAAQYGVPCQASVEVPMACGFGACLGCAIKVKDGGEAGHRFAIACCEGPVFEGNSILWD